MTFSQVSNHIKVTKLHCQQRMINIAFRALKYECESPGTGKLNQRKHGNRS
jgi:hypothetical protein